MALRIRAARVCCCVHAARYICVTKICQLRNATRSYKRYATPQARSGGAHAAGRWRAAAGIKAYARERQCGGASVRGEGAGMACERTSRCYAASSVTMPAIDVTAAIRARSYGANRGAVTKA